jgi:hypothetical protein
MAVAHAPPIRPYSCLAANSRIFSPVPIASQRSRSRRASRSSSSLPAPVLCLVSLLLLSPCHGRGAPMILLKLEARALGGDDEGGDDNGDDGEGLERGRERAVVGEAAVREVGGREREREPAEEALRAADDRRALVRVRLLLGDDLRRARERGRARGGQPRTFMMREKGCFGRSRGGGGGSGQRLV